MEHYIIVKFIDNYNYLDEINNIKELFNESLNINGINKIDIYISNSKLSNRYDLMIKMNLSYDALIEFDNSWIHKKWKEDYGKYIESKTIFDCDNR